MPPIAYSRLLRHRLIPISRRVQARKGHLTEAADEAVVGIEMVQAFGREDDVRTRFDGRAEAVRDGHAAGARWRRATCRPALPAAARHRLVLFFGGRG